MKIFCLISPSRFELNNYESELYKSFVSNCSRLNNSQKGLSVSMSIKVTT